MATKPKKEKLIAIRLSEQEKATIDLRATELGLSRSQYLLRPALSAREKALTKEERELYSTLIKTKTKLSEIEAALDAAETAGNLIALKQISASISAAGAAWWSKVVAPK